ncbi:hypothetical protein [Thiohalospira sp.]|uniref:hypothetical protein n=1 Tax=Thiohalospira sp. TaxID=3080549 RepID=UPI00398120CD
MKVERTEDGHILLEMEVGAGNKLADEIHAHAAEMRSPVLELSSLLREARYNAGNDFRQPPNAWGPDAAPPPSTKT